MLWKWIGVVSAIIGVAGTLFAVRDTIVGYADDHAAMKKSQSEIMTAINEHQVSTLRVLRQTCRNGAKDRYALDKCEE